MSAASRSLDLGARSGFPGAVKGRAAVEAVKPPLAIAVVALQAVDAGATVIAAGQRGAPYTGLLILRSPATQRLSRALLANEFKRGTAFYSWWRR